MSWWKICSKSPNENCSFGYMHNDWTNPLKLVKSEPFKLAKHSFNIYYKDVKYFIFHIYFDLHKSGSTTQCFFEKCYYNECIPTCCVIMHSTAMDIVTWVAFTFLVTTKTKKRWGTNLRTVFTIVTRRACYKSEDKNT